MLIVGLLCLKTPRYCIRLLHQKTNQCCFKANCVSLRWGYNKTPSDIAGRSAYRKLIVAISLRTMATWLTLENHFYLRCTIQRFINGAFDIFIPGEGNP